jgi:hypothetical protein
MDNNKPTKTTWIWIMKKVFDFIVILVILFMIVYAFVQTEVKLLPEFENTSVLKRIDSLSVFTNNPIAHNSILVKVLQEQQAIVGNDLLANRTVEMQIRLFYVAILAGLSSLLFHKDNESKHTIRRVLLSLIILMYLLEVHLNDLNKRQYAVSYIKDVAIDSLVHLSPTDATWFAIKYDSVATKWSKASEKCNTWSRKLVTALNHPFVCIIHLSLLVTVRK